jgi:hypothetical protein
MAHLDGWIWPTWTAPDDKMPGRTKVDLFEWTYSKRSGGILRLVRRSKGWRRSMAGDWPGSSFVLIGFKACRAERPAEGGDAVDVANRIKAPRNYR